MKIATPPECGSSCAAYKQELYAVNRQDGGEQRLTNLANFSFLPSDFDVRMICQVRFSPLLERAFVFVCANVGPTYLFSVDMVGVQRDEMALCDAVGATDQCLDLYRYQRPLSFKTMLEVDDRVLFVVSTEPYTSKEGFYIRVVA